MQRLACRDHDGSNEDNGDNVYTRIESKMAQIGRHDGIKRRRRKRVYMYRECRNCIGYVMSWGMGIKNPEKKRMSPKRREVMICSC